jgi:hypothetical protein
MARAWEALGGAWPEGIALNRETTE